MTKSDYYDLKGMAYCVLAIVANSILASSIFIAFAILYFTLSLIKAHKEIG